jgi:DNA-binding SARP family transcriptional activator
MADADAPARFELLGPLRAWRGVDAVPLGPIQQQVVLAALLLHANRPLSRPALVQAIWGDTPPACAVNLVQRHVSGLRRALDSRRAGLLVWRGGGYLLSVAREDVDLTRVEDLAATAQQARATGFVQDAAKGLHAALELWRGPVCDALNAPLLDAERARLGEWRIGLIEDRIELDLQLGDGATLVPELRRLVADHPLREGLCALLMRALCRAGRQAEALAAFQDARRTLRDELGIEPGHALQAVQRQVLRSDESLLVSTPPGPAQLPQRIPRFCGRDDELDRLRAIVRSDGGRVALVVGTAGVGKTGFALHWAHQARGDYPDGQLHVNLRGFDPARAAMPPVEALHGFLTALGVSAGRLPGTVEACAGLYRTLMRGRRMLVLLDNARDADQVRPLLPGSDTCQVVVTSRDSLAGLVAEVFAQPLRLEVLPPPEARRLLAARLGARRIAAEPEAADEIIRTCAGLPLALAIVAARGAAQPGFPLAALANQLRVSTDGLDVFAAADELTDVRAVFSWSYESLPPGAARVFRLLAVHPGPSVSLTAAASLLGQPVAQARSALVALSRAHLVEEQSPGRFGFHDLLRAYAAEAAAGAESAENRRDALHRVLVHYVRTGHRADRLLNPAREPLAPAPETAGVTAVDLADGAAALEWFYADLPALFAVVDHRPVEGLDDDAWDLIWGLETFLDRRGVRQERRYDEACDRYARALDEAEHRGEREQQAQLQIRLTWVLERLGRLGAALEHARRAHDLFTALGNRAGIAHSKNAIGWCHTRLGAHDEARRWCESALSLMRDLSEHDGEAHTWDSLGHIHHRLGAPGAAVDAYRHAVDLWRRLGIHTYEAETMERMAEACDALGDREGAYRARTSAAVIRDNLLHHRLGKES